MLIFSVNKNSYLFLKRFSPAATDVKKPAQGGLGGAEMKNPPERVGVLLEGSYLFDIDRNEVDSASECRAEAAHERDEFPSLSTDFLVQVCFSRHAGIDAIKARLDPYQAISRVSGKFFKSGYACFHAAIMRRLAAFVNPRLKPVK
jgi:hypothetical protein